MADGKSLSIRHDRVSWAPTDDTIVILDLTKSHYLSLNPSGSFLWRLLVTGSTAADLTQALSVEFELTGTEAGDDVDRFLADLRQRDLLVDS